MPKLENIPGFDPKVAELFEAVGYYHADDFSSIDEEALLDELVKANAALQILDQAPTAQNLNQWKNLVLQEPSTTEVAEESVEVERQAIEEIPEVPATQQAFNEQQEIDFEKEQEAATVNFEEDPEVISILKKSPEASFLDPALIKKHELAVSDITEGVLLTECSGDVEMQVAAVEIEDLEDLEEDLEEERIAVKKRTRGELEVSRIRSFEEADSDDHHVKPLDRGERPALSVSDNLNKGVSKDSRRYIKGVLHPTPGGVKLAALVTVIVQITFFASLISLPMMIASKAVIPWAIGFSVSFLLFGLCYLMLSLRARCRVCGQRQFAPKQCLKHRKAHRVPLLGYIFPTALHAMFFQWFYCIYCGTAVRLKK